MPEILFLSLNVVQNCKISLGLTPRPPAVFRRNQTCFPGPHFTQFFWRAIIFFHFFINADCLTLGLDLGDAFLIFDVHRCVPVVNFVQYFITNTVVLAC